MWELDHKESWVLKNWCFWTVVLEKTLESPLDCRRSSQSMLKEISPEYSLEGLMLKLKLQYLGHLMWRTDTLEKTLMLRRIEAGGRGDNRGWGGWMASPPRWTWAWVSSGSWWWTGKPSRLQSMGSQRVGHNWATELKYLAISFLENKIYILNKFCSPIQTRSEVLPTKQFSNTSCVSYHSIQFW